MNGIEVLKEIQQVSPDTNVMMITAYTMHELVGEAKKQGAQAVFPKPLDLEKVIPQIEKLKDNAQIKKEASTKNYQAKTSILVWD